ncbi:MAG: CotH kinase family protein [Bacteroidaceae bacterium]|nr:CotH kinase family protein [Bacteroidaceae bacterium]
MKFFTRFLCAGSALLLLLAACADTDGVVLPDEDELRASAAPQTRVFDPTEENPTGVPVLYINTQDSADIASKTEYVAGEVTLVSSASPDWNIDRAPMRIRGRGNSTWMAAKKPYKIKFDRNRSLLGMNAEKDWVLLANWFDRPMLHTPIAFWLGARSSLDWTPSGDFAEVYLNGAYNGLYYITEQVEAADARLVLPRGSFLIEVDQPGRVDEGEVAFRAYLNTFVIKTPSVLPDDEQYTWIKDYVTAFERSLYSTYWLDAARGYAAYIDMESFADWYIINELVKNTDAVFFSSCYLHITPGGQLKMGPLWDFDLSLGSTSNPNSKGVEGFWVRRGPYFARMMQDPAFYTLVRERFDYFKSQLPALLDFIEGEAAAHNEVLWDNLGRKDSWLPFYGGFYPEVDALKDFLTQRTAWLDANLPYPGMPTGIHTVTY